MVSAQSWGSKVIFSRSVRAPRCAPPTSTTFEQTFDEEEHVSAAALQAIKLRTDSSVAGGGPPTAAASAAGPPQQDSDGEEEVRADGDNEKREVERASVDQLTQYPHTND